jgi:hypothetical protein
MRKLAVTAFVVLALTGLVAPSANATGAPPSKLSLTANITSFHASAGRVTASGILNGRLSSGTSVARDSAPVRFAVVAARHGGRCNVLTLRLAPLNLELLGVQVTTSFITLEVNARRGAVLGNLFCALAHAKVTLPRAARVTRALNSTLHGRPLPVFAASDSLRARTSQSSCQVLHLVLGPLHLNLLGLEVDLYGQTKADPVIVTINGQPDKGLLGQLLCGLAGGTGVTSLGGLQSLLTTLGLNLSTTQIQNLLNELGITNISAGLTQLDLNRILQKLGLGSALPPG